MKVSVIIPVYNKVHYVSRAISSVLSQTYGDFELILVDDGSTDGSREILNEVKDPRVRVVTQVNGGPGAARNTGLRVAGGKLIAFLDADDEWLPTYLEVSTQILEQSLESAAVVSAYFEYPRGISTSDYWKGRGIRDEVATTTPSTPPRLVIDRLAFMSCWSTVSRREVLEKWGGFYAKDRCTYAEDAHLWLKILLNEKVRFNLKPLVKFHTEASELSANLTRVRPIEPFLINPEEILNAAPLPLKDVAAKVLGYRAAKTAAVLGYYGEWQKAKELLSRFPLRSYYTSKHLLPALLSTTPAVGFVSRFIRFGKKLRYNAAHHSKPIAKGLIVSSPPEVIH